MEVVLHINSNYKLNNPSRSRAISQTLNVPVNEIDKGNVYSIVVFLKLVLPKSDYREFIGELDDLIKSYSNGFSSASFNEIMLAMGFNENWNVEII